MAKEEELQVGETFYVNEATLELLRRKIESQVRKSFLQSIGLPIGGAGVVAIVLSVLVWIPMKVSPIVEDFVKNAKGQQVVQEAVYGSTVTYLQEDPKGSKSVRDQVEKSTKSYLADPNGGQRMLGPLVAKATEGRLESEVAGYFASAKGSKHLSSQLKKEAAAYFSREEGRKELNRLLKAEINSDDIIKTIDNAIRDFTDDLKETVAFHLGKVVTKPVIPVGVIKENEEELQKFLRDSNVEELKRSRKPIVIKFYGLGSWRYNPGMINLYINQLNERFGEQFKYCLVFYKDGEDDKFMALVSKYVVQEKTEQFCDILVKSTNELPLDAAKRDLAELSDNRTTFSIGESFKVWEALVKTNEFRGDQIDEEVPVFNSSEEFLGFTSRRRLISELFNPDLG